MLLKLLNLDFLCICFIADFHSHGWSSSSDWGMHLLRPVWTAWPAVSCQFVLWFFFFSQLGHVEDFPAHTHRTHGIFIFFSPSCGLQYIQYTTVQSWCFVCAQPTHSLQPFNVTSLTTSDLLLYLNYDALVQRMRWLTGGCNTLKFSVPNWFFLSQYLSLNPVMLLRLEDLEASKALSCQNALLIKI